MDQDYEPWTPTPSGRAQDDDFSMNQLTKTRTTSKAHNQETQITALETITSTHRLHKHAFKVIINAKFLAYKSYSNLSSQACQLVNISQVWDCGPN